tara:strand:+ start:160 stop:444 length:285 start_codon:yes stop_codon:yes gene_type:complete
LGVVIASIIILVLYTQSVEKKMKNLKWDIKWIGRCIGMSHTTCDTKTLGELKNQNNESLKKIRTSLNDELNEKRIMVSNSTLFSIFGSPHYKDL